MRFDFTGGQKAKYMIAIHRWNGTDNLYYHDYKSASAKFNELCTGKQPKGTSISLYDMIKDVRKAFKKF